MPKDNSLGFTRYTLIISVALGSLEQAGIFDFVPWGDSAVPRPERYPPAGHVDVGRVSAERTKIKPRTSLGSYCQEFPGDDKVSNSRRFVVRSTVLS